MVQTWGRGLSVLGGGILPLAPVWPLASACFLVSFDGAVRWGKKFRIRGKTLDELIDWGAAEKRLTRHISWDFVDTGEIYQLGALVSFVANHSI